MHEGASAAARLMQRSAATAGASRRGFMGEVRRFAIVLLTPIFTDDAPPPHS